ALTTTQSYSYFLRWVNPLPMRHPFDAIFANVWGLALLPPLARELTSRLTNLPRAGHVTFWFMATCFFTMANGLILVRDAWVATCLVAALVFVLHRRYYAVALAVALGAILRPASGFLILLSVGIVAIARE